MTKTFELDHSKFKKKRDISLTARMLLKITRKYYERLP